MSEKPAGVYTRQVRAMNEAAARSDKVFGVMFNQRARAEHQKLKELVDSGELGEIVRTNYIITDWFRAQSYYDGGGWRATWAGEGGGVLVNQCPHNLDLWQWTCGMPLRVRAFVGMGKYHDIEVDDDVTAYVELRERRHRGLHHHHGRGPGNQSPGDFRRPRQAPAGGRQHHLLAHGGSGEPLPPGVEGGIRRSRGVEVRGPGARRRPGAPGNHQELGGGDSPRRPPAGAGG